MATPQFAIGMTVTTIFSDKPKEITGRRRQRATRYQDAHFVYTLFDKSKYDPADPDYAIENRRECEIAGMVSL